MITVKELKEMIKDASDNSIVMVRTMGHLSEVTDITIDEELGEDGYLWIRGS